MRVRSFVPWLLVGVFTLGGAGVGTVLAQVAVKDSGWPPPEGAACKPSKKDTDEAKTLYTLGNNAYQTSNYTDAIKYWKDAYKRDCSAHLLLKNLGKAYEADAQYAAAVEVYKLYRTRGGPKGEELDLIDQKIANLSKKIPGGDATGTATAPTATATTTASETTTAPTATATVVPTATASVAPTSTTNPPPGNGPGIAPWLVVGGGGVMVLVGGILWLGGNSKLSKASDDFAAAKCNVPGHTTSSTVCQAFADDGTSGKNTRTVGIVLTGVGVVAAGAGLAWALVGGGKKDSASVNLGPGPGLAGLSLSGAF